MDDLTLGKVLTEAYRGQVDYFVICRRLQGPIDQGNLMEINRRNPMSAKAQKAQIRTLLEEQRQTVLAECNAKVSHHEPQAAQAEEERRLLQGQAWQQKLEFREAHQRSLT